MATIIEKAQKSGRKYLNEIESKQLLKEAGVPTTDTRLAISRNEAIAFAKQIGFPVVLKIISADIVHKSDIGGVKLELGDGASVGKAYDEMMATVKAKQPSAKIDGVSVQNMARPGVEVIIVVSRDRQFGPVLMFGMGGILVELLKDVSFRIVPITRHDAHEMIREMKSFPLLEGYRGSEPASIEALEDMLLKVSELAARTPEIKELDLNPVFARRDDAIAVTRALSWNRCTAMGYPWPARKTSGLTAWKDQDDPFREYREAIWTSTERSKRMRKS
jgi:acyl-CoA synthetase (NDP forming)